MELTKKQIEQISGAIISSFINLHFLEEVNSTGIFEQRVKYNVKRTMKDLIDIETKFYQRVEEVDEKDLGDKLVANNLEFLEWLLNEFDFNDFTKIQEVCLAYKLDGEKMRKVSDEIHINNGAEVIE